MMPREDSSTFSIYLSPRHCPVIAIVSGNLPLHMGLTETLFQQEVWREMKERGFCNNANENPVLCVWFAKDKGNYGFVEFGSVEETERALTMDGMMCMGVSLKVSRPNDYSTASQGQNQAMALMGTQSAQRLQSGNGGDASAPAPPPPAPSKGSQPLMDSRRSKYIRFVQIVVGEIMESEQEMDEVFEDIKEGAGSPESVVSGAIITARNKGDSIFNVGDVVLEFASVETADAFYKTMFGRKYEARPITMVKLTEADFISHAKPVIARYMRRADGIDRLKTEDDDEAAERGSLDRSRSPDLEREEDSDTRERERSKEMENELAEGMENELAEGMENASEKELEKKPDEDAEELEKKDEKEVEKEDEKEVEKEDEKDVENEDEKEVEKEVEKEDEKEVEKEVKDEDGQEQERAVESEAAKMQQDEAVKDQEDDFMDADDGE
eukprot:GHVU01023266.1.p1 GENE.GHVU01023266.1~~GHVU01023266.1.p1  ORF type:complete len:440 (-),score=132.60 GHVU01023266.1:1009-2328(-)